MSVVQALLRLRLRDCAHHLVPPHPLLAPCWLTFTLFLRCAGVLYMYAAEASEQH